MQQFLLIFFRRVTEFIIGLVRSFWPFGSVGVVGFRSADRPFWVGRLFCFGATFVFFIFYLLRYDENENVVWQPFDTFISGICAVSRLTSFLLPSLSFLLSFVTGFNIFFLFCGFHFVCVCVCLRTCVEKMRRSVLFLLLLFFLNTEFTEFTGFTELFVFLLPSELFFCHAIEGFLPSLRGCAEFGRRLPTFTELYWVLLGFNGFY